MVFLACVHLALFLALSLSPGNSLVSSWCAHVSFLVLTVSNSFLFTPVLVRTHSFVLTAVHETCRIFLSPFISKSSKRVSSFFLCVQLSQPYITTGQTSAFISRIFVEIGMRRLFRIFSSDAPIASPCLTWYTEFRHTLTTFCNQGPKVRERIHVLQLLILTEYMTRYAVALHYLGLFDVNEFAVFTADSV